MKQFLSLWVWQFPQMLLGYIMSRLWKKRLITLSKIELEFLYGLEELTGYKIYISTYYSQKNDKLLKHLSGFSLGKYVCLNDAHKLKTLKHEKGHTKQSVKLGLLYLIVIGLPSSIGNLLSRVSETINKNYFNLPWEKWADDLGGVKR